MKKIFAAILFLFLFASPVYAARHHNHKINHHVHHNTGHLHHHRNQSVHHGKNSHYKKTHL